MAIKMNWHLCTYKPSQGLSGNLRVINKPRTSGVFYCEAGYCSACDMAVH